MTRKLLIIAKWIVILLIVFFLGSIAWDAFRFINTTTISATVDGTQIDIMPKYDVTTAELTVTRAGKPVATYTLGEIQAYHISTVTIPDYLKRTDGSFDNAKAKDYYFYFSGNRDSKYFAGFFKERIVLKAKKR